MNRVSVHTEIFLKVLTHLNTCSFGFFSIEYFYEFMVVFMTHVCRVSACKAFLSSSSFSDQRIVAKTIKIKMFCNSGFGSELRRIFIVIFRFAHLSYSHFSAAYKSSDIEHTPYALMKSELTYRHTVVWASPSCPACCSGKRFYPPTGSQRDSCNGARCLLQEIHGVAVSLCRSPKTSTCADTGTLTGCETNRL